MSASLARFSVSVGRVTDMGGVTPQLWSPVILLMGEEVEAEAEAEERVVLGREEAAALGCRSRFTEIKADQWAAWRAGNVSGSRKR